MTDRQKRREQRLRTMSVKKLSLYSAENNSFCQNLSPLEAWELLAKLSREMWFIETGKMAPNRLDKSQVRVFTRAGLKQQSNDK